MAPPAPPARIPTPPAAHPNSHPGPSQISLPCPANSSASGTGSPKRNDPLEPSTRSIRSPVDAPPSALDRGSTTTPSSRVSSHIPPVLSRPPRASSSLTAAMPSSQPNRPASPQNAAPPRPSALLSLLRCASCRLLLEAPTTLNCGHTVCSKHMSADGHVISITPSLASSSQAVSSDPGPAHTPDSSAPLQSSYRSLPSACPVEGCRPRQPARVRMVSRSNDPNNGITVTPATDQPPPAAHAPTISQNPLHSRPKLDVTVSKLLEVITTAARAQTAPAADLSGQPPSHNDSDSEDHSDDESTERIPRMHHPQLSRSRTPDRNGDDGPPQSRSGINHDRGESASPPRPRKRQRTHVPVQTATGVPDRTSPALTFEKELLGELTCEICFMLLHQPITTPCQHTFCSVCLERSLDHSAKCPLCRLDLPPNSYFYQHANNQVVVEIIAKAFPQLLQERIAAAENDGIDSRLDTAIFVCQLSYPGMPTLLHFFEPRYRLMLRRCLASPTPRFGMVMPRQTANNTEGNDYGTMLEIKSVQMLSDGRSMVETFGTFRFRILERGTLDGYLVGRIERIDDYPPEVEAEIERNAMMNPTESALPLRGIEQSNQELVDVCRRFLDQLRNGTAPWVVQRLNNTYGPMPTDVSSFSFWVALVLPIDEQEKAKLLPIRSARMRLRLVVHWIEQLNNNWWFSSGCVVG
ncbi:hypothetical protein BDV93DRAFT_519641 [Ceratobasidium sp. AG-I]|nr:hypothetical protein BDV93DRAFT_519641 [Ceratobasidium sp. AG-I]